MTREPERIEIADKPDLARVAEVVCATHEPVVLIRDGEEVARVVPSQKPKPHSQEDWEAFLSSAGSWADGDFDADAFLAYIRQQREFGGRPPVQL